MRRFQIRRFFIPSKSAIRPSAFLRPSLLGKFSLAAGVFCLAASLQLGRVSAADDSEPSSDKQSQQVAEEKYVPKSKAQLRRELTTIQYRVTQNEDTEPAFRNKYWDNKKKGSYRCIVCDQLLFDSATKYKSGTGWPSFWAPKTKTAVGFRVDNKLFYSRTEVHCSRCKAHLGHVFDDGPIEKTGKRYCMNSASLRFLTEDEEKKRSESLKGKTEETPSVDPSKD